MTQRFSDDAIYQWLGKPNPFSPNTGPWKRTKLASRLSGKTIGAFRKAAAHERAFDGRDPITTLLYLASKRLIELEGYQGRANKDEMGERREALIAIVEEMQPITVRGVFYQAEVRGLVEKQESGYGKVQSLLVDMRRNNELP